MRAVNELIDEISDAPISAVDNFLRKLPDAFYDDVCYVVEYELFRRHTRFDLPPLSQYSSRPVLSKILRLLDDPINNQSSQLSLQAVGFDALAIPVTLGENPNWLTFKKRAEASARSVGFSDLVSAAFAGAIHEMADNIVQHSQAETSGIAGFRAFNRTFQYVVGDAGIGILASLRRSPELKRLRDDIEALSLAVLPGVSRYGRESGRGYGYRAVFSPLNGASGAVRLRSGAAVLNVTGVSAAADRGICSQRPLHNGVVLAVSVIAND